MLFFTENKKDCTGCTACMAVCPVNCISMKPDEQGFLYPEADLDACINCGQCEARCPMRHPGYVDPECGECKAKDRFDGSLNTIQHAAAAITKDNETWKLSASGGAFSEICRAVNRLLCEKKADVWVYGAAFEGLEVKHCGKKIPEIQDFRKSKYVQSDMQNCFREIKELLGKEEKVIFSGTPCQVAGLRAYLGKAYENLFCIDLICHGVGSPAVFKRYLEEAGRGDKVQRYTFRAKVKKYGNYHRYVSKIERESGKTEHVCMDNYHRLFLNQLCLRKSCGENCPYRDVHRQGDVTIADFNNFSRLFPDICDDRGYSTIVINTAKGERLFEQLFEFMEIFPANVEDIKKYNPLFAGTAPGNPMSDDFFADYEQGMSIEELCRKYVPASKESPVSFIKRHLPYSIKYSVFKIMRKIRIKE